MKKTIFAIIIAVTAIIPGFSFNKKINDFFYTRADFSTIVKCGDIPDASCGMQSPLFYIGTQTIVPFSILDMQNYVP